ncbi:MAG: GreA/GreB family elongation factor [Spirochaetia bacterium]|jgi:transcription elongation factor GreB|nr:GreA/GreB family elongation factor [Spirochaetia bacterium]
MSRAFVDEDSGSDETDDMHEIPLPIAPGMKNYMTPEGALHMMEELRSLIEVERPKAAAVLAGVEAEAKAGPLREISLIDRRISYLSRMKASLEVVEPPPSLERVVFGLVARVKDEAGKEASYRIVGVDESDPERGLISWGSPVAKALIGRSTGDRVLVKLPLGERRMKIIGIEYAKE